MELTGNTIFITGGGSGIGRALAEALHQRGNKVIISGRRKANLAATIEANPGMNSIELDIADPASIRRVSAELISRYPKLNVLPLDEFLQETMEALATDADEIMVARAKFLRDQAGPNVSAFVNTFNERFELQPPEAEPVQETVSRS